MNLWAAHIVAICYISAAVLALLGPAVLSLIPVVITVAVWLGLVRQP